MGIKAHQQVAKVLCQEIKRLIRSSSMTYRDLAKKMNLSESGLKKILSKEDMPTSRLMEFCEHLDLSLTDLLKVIESQNFIDITFSKEQEITFEKDYRIFLFYWFLVYERRSLEETMSLMNINKNTSEKLLIKLDKLNLLGYLTNGKLKIPSPKPVRWADDSVFVKNIYKRWANAIMQSALSNLKDTNKYFMLRYLQMSQENYNELITLLRKIENQSLNKSTRQMRLKDQKLKHVRWLTIIDQLSWGENDLKSLE